MSVSPCLHRSLLDRNRRHLQRRRLCRGRGLLHPIAQLLQRRREGGSVAGGGQRRVAAAGPCEAGAGAQEAGGYTRPLLSST
jgi:hypothetical protein